MASETQEPTGGPGTRSPPGATPPARPEPERPEPERPEPERAEGPWGGPTYRHRGARIECTADGRLCGLFLDGHPFSGRTFAAPGTAVALVDLWLDNRG